MVMPISPLLLIPRGRKANLILSTINLYGKSMKSANSICVKDVPFLNNATLYGQFSLTTWHCPLHDKVLCHFIRSTLNFVYG